MKSKVVYSPFATILTMALLVVLTVGYIALIHDNPASFFVLAILIVLVVCALLYGPVALKVTPDSIVLCSILRHKKLSMLNVESVELFKPTLGAIRIFGSGGFMGYWGIFSEGDIGRYQAFYGKASDCFLVRMKNGDKYLLGCKNPEQIVNYILAHK